MDDPLEWDEYCDDVLSLGGIGAPPAPTLGTGFLLSSLLGEGAPFGTGEEGGEDWVWTFELERFETEWGMLFLPVLLRPILL